MKVIRGTDLDYLKGFVKAKNKQLAKEATVEALAKLTKKYNDKHLKVVSTSKTKPFFEEVKELVTAHKLTVV